MRSRILLLVGVLAAAWVRIGGNPGSLFQRSAAEPEPIKASEPSPPPAGAPAVTNSPGASPTLVLSQTR